MAFLSWLYCLLVDFYIQTTVMYNARDYQNIRVNDIESNVRRDIYRERERKTNKHIIILNAWQSTASIQDKIVDCV